MTDAIAQTPDRFSKLKWSLLVSTAGVIILMLLVKFFSWDLLRGPVNRYVSAELGRKFEITRRLDVDLQPWPWGKTTVKLDGLELANPPWAADRYLVKANAADFEIRLWPLVTGKINLPRLKLTGPQIGLQAEPDGKKSWTLTRDTAEPGATPSIGSLEVDQGVLKYRAAAQGANMQVNFSVAPEGSQQLPLSFKVDGIWKNVPFNANGRTGGVLQLSKDLSQRFPVEVNANAGQTSLKTKGTVENLIALSGLNASFDLQGKNLGDLYQLLGVVLPSTPPYKLSGQLDKSAEVWAATKIRGMLGSSDLSGALTFDNSAAKPVLTGKVQSKVLDMNDLLPVIGLPVRAASGGGNKSRTANAATATPRQGSPARSGRKVLSTAPLDLTKLNAMNADVMYTALDIRHVEQLPLDAGSAQVKLQNGTLQLDPLVLGVAGGKISGRVVVDVNVAPAAFETRMTASGLALNRLFPTVENTKSSFGKFNGQASLKGRGNSMAQMLASANGDAAMLMGKGEISNMLMEYLGLDGGEVIKFFLRGDRNVQLRCAAAAFDVKQGLMRSKVIVLDTSDTVINGAGQISLVEETLDLTLSPQPKDKSILSFRSPLKINGTFADPTAGPDKAALAGRVGLGIALGVINPFLALLATVETGPGEDADCSGSLAMASKSSKPAPPAKARVSATDRSTPKVIAP
jgi:AsmA family protein